MPKEERAHAGFSIPLLSLATAPNKTVYFSKYIKTDSHFHGIYLLPHLVFNSHIMTH